MMQVSIISQTEECFCMKLTVYLLHSFWLLHLELVLFIQIIYFDVILQCSDQTPVWDCRKFHTISSIYRTGNEVPLESCEDVA